MKDEKIINDMLERAKKYFSNDEKIYIYQCKKYDPVPGFVVGE